LGELRVLNRITQTVAGGRDLEGALAVVAEETLSVIGARSCAIALVDGERQGMTILASRGQPGAGTPVRRQRFSIDASPALGRLVGGAAPLYLSGPADAAAGPELAQVLEDQGGRGLLLVPLAVRSTTIGAIVLESGRAGRGFGAGDVSLAETVAGQIAGAVENARLFDELLEYVDQVGLVTGAASAVESGDFRVESLDAVGRRDDALGQLARVFQGMVREVAAREQRLRREVQQLRIEIDETRAAQQVDEITESEYFRRLQAKVDQLRVDTAR
ncbi:MAG TPA: GAF domain-containing protein, partial [Acidimicrobiales bacterium]|nr:GAF domain-containing protein [Acidimicrobiales bacterium]